MDTLILRQIREEIVRICDYIYRQNWNAVCDGWNLLEKELQNSTLENKNFYIALAESRICISNGNYLRLHDLLKYDIDFFIYKELYSLSVDDRRSLTEEARKENIGMLQKNHQNISSIIQEIHRFSRIIYSYEGADNISLSIKEGNQSFRLFSNTNPYLESLSLINANKTLNNCTKEIYVLGFGRGYIIRALKAKYPKAQINVYLPNKDVFNIVLSNILVNDILCDKKIDFFYDPTCLNFEEILRKKIQEREDIGFYVDYQELRACVRSIAAMNNLLVQYKYKGRDQKRAVNNCVGEDIYECTKK